MQREPIQGASTSILAPIETRHKPGGGLRVVCPEADYFSNKVFMSNCDGCHLFRGIIFGEGVQCMYWVYLGRVRTTLEGGDKGDETGKI